MIITRYKSFIFIILVFLYMFTLNLLTPLFADDYNYSFMWDKSKRIESLMDVMKSQYMHYFEWGGRTVAHTIGQILLMTNKFISSFFNALMFVMFIYLIYWHSQGKRINLNSNIIILLLTTFFCWTSIPNFGETTIWLIGSVNYLWTTVIILIFLLPYRQKMLINHVFNNNFLSSLGMFLMGILAGWTNENTAFSTILLTLIVVFYFYIKRCIEKWMLTGFSGILVGFLLLILAPGNMMRASNLQRSEDYSFVLYHIKMPILSTIKIMLFQVPVWVTFLILIAVLLNHCIKSQIKFSEIHTKYGGKLIFCFMLITISIVNNLVMFASPYFPLRAGFGSSVFLIIGVLSLIRIDIIREKFEKKNFLIKIGISAFLIVSMGDVAGKYIDLNKENNSRLNLVNQKKGEGEYSIVIPPYSFEYMDSYRSHFGHVFVSDIGEDPNVWPNNIYARYLDLKSISIEKQKE